MINYFFIFMITNAMNHGKKEKAQAIKIVCKRGSMEVDSAMTTGMVFESSWILIEESLICSIWWMFVLLNCCDSFKNAMSCLTSNSWVVCNIPMEKKSVEMAQVKGTYITEFSSITLIDFLSRHVIWVEIVFFVRKIVDVIKIKLEAKSISFDQSRCFL